ncbi:MAG TPA: FliH/SctL family protein [Pirellulaceae bacterium]|jgi:flagellar assembly protein FliH|nr:FliH/SctL family protein [Pirellulaceae bacterium]
MSRILKRDAGGTIPAGHSPQSFQLEDIQGRTEAYLAEVQAKAKTILEEARQKVRQEASIELERLRKEAIQTGNAQAVETLKKDRQTRIDSEVAAVRPVLEAAANELVSMRASWIAHWQDRLADLASAMAERIVRRELSQRPELALDWIRESLELASGCDDVVVSLSPQDHERLGDDVRRIAKEIGALSSARIVADPQVGVGGCRVRTRYGEIDNTIETQIRRLKEEVAEG